MEKQYIAHTSSSMRKYRSPGPAAYNIKETIGDVPAIKIKGRYKTRQSVNTAAYVNPPSPFGKVPAVKIGNVTKSRQGDITPGASYIPPAFGSDAPRISFSKIDTSPKSKSALSARRTRRNSDETPGPGPGTYNTRDTTFDPSKNRHGIKMKGAHDFRYSTAYSPGPANYKVNYEFDSTRPSSQKTYIHTRPPDKKIESTPGYRNLGSTLGGPRWTIKSREDDEIFLV